MEDKKLRDINYLKGIVSHMDFVVTDLGGGRVRVASESQQFNFEFDTIAEAIDYVTDVN